MTKEGELRQLFFEAHGLYDRIKSLRAGRAYDKRLMRLCQRAALRMLRRELAWLKYARLVQQSGLRGET